MQGHFPGIRDAAETIHRNSASTDAASLGRGWVEAAALATTQQPGPRNLAKKYKNVFPKDDWTLFQQICGFISLRENENVSNINDESYAADIVTLNERNINDWAPVTDSNEVRDSMMTGALENVERIMKERNGSGCVSSEQTEE